MVEAIQMKIRINDDFPPKGHLYFKRLSNQPTLIFIKETAMSKYFRDPLLLIRLVTWYHST